jgi:hypothetical protein
MSRADRAFLKYAEETALLAQGVRRPMSRQAQWLWLKRQRAERELYQKLGPARYQALLEERARDAQPNPKPEKLTAEAKATGSRMCRPPSNPPADEEEKAEKLKAMRRPFTG